MKNRDYRGEHGALQQVFRHRDPERGARVLLCVGSLGSPGAFSSGINSDGLAVADTQIGTRDHGIGWLRYFLMTALLRECGCVADALAFIAAVPHAGGGSLVLGDARRCGGRRRTRSPAAAAHRAPASVGCANQPSPGATAGSRCAAGADDLVRFECHSP